MKKFSLVALLAGVFMFNVAQAGILIDPYYAMGSSKMSGDVDDSTDDLTAMGARLGWKFLLVSAGIDYQMMTVKDDDDTKITNTSVFVGIDLPILLRAWAEYFISSDVKDSDTKFKNGTSIGLGFTGLPFVSLNVELQNINYENSGYEIKTAATIFSLSVPLSF
jgi:hypothetical protein